MDGFGTVKYPTISCNSALRNVKSLLDCRRTQVRNIGDAAVLPLVLLLGSIFFFVLTPITNSYTRIEEHEADIYGLNASRKPDGFAQGAIHLGEYRKMSPGPLEEWIFFDHPSGRNRIHDAMTWKVENLKLFEQPAH